MYENTDLYVFDKDNKLKYKKLNPEDTKGQWTQIVYHVDDAPRHSGSATWIHKDGRHFWESTADAPLPRREYTTREDYNVLNRTNHHEIFQWGWLHGQDNRKVVRADGAADVVIAEETGKEYYKKVEDGKCAIAKNYWNEYAPLWAAVRESWDQRLAQKKDLELTPNVGDTYLYKKIWKLTPNQTKEAKAEVKNYIVK